MRPWPCPRHRKAASFPRSPGPRMDARVIVKRLPCAPEGGEVVASVIRPAVSRRACIASAVTVRPPMLGSPEAPASP